MTNSRTRTEKAWGHDTSALENAGDIAARERYDRLMAERVSWAGDEPSGCTEDPPFQPRGPHWPSHLADH
ncbi:hypothetical protein ACFVDQ_18320 [Streptomyces sp. NPDC057684]|uniref:hypothetical protein n=1 Tax=unclassified Streptomyces TaxID=2593676 RepID=UPI00368D8757